MTSLTDLENARNLARKNNFDEKWIKENIKVGINSEGQPTTRTELLNNKLIKAKTIIENIEGLDKKLILSRELKRDK